MPPNYGRILFFIFISTTLLFMLAVPAAAADTTIWTKANEFLKDLYTQILTISTIAGVVTAATALLLMNFSKNERTVAESRAWLKRIIVCYVLINCLGFVVAYITPFMTGGKFTG